jgi:prolipoprotein diacylglyceryltransferase
MTDRLSSLAVHPTQLYESVFGLVLFVFAVWLLNHRKFRGQVLVTVAALYGLWRFLIEYVRDDPERGFAFGFSTSQLISLAIIPVCIIAYIHLRKEAEANGDIKLPTWALEASTEAVVAPTTTDDRPAKYRPKKIGKIKKKK